MDTSIVLFSHHGSNESGELTSILEYLPSRSILGIISSDIDAASRIPKFYPSYKGYPNIGHNFLQIVKKIGSPITEMSERVFCVSHNISFYNQLIDSPQTIPACLVDDGRISIIPVFSTGDIGDNGLFYKINIDSDGTISMIRNADTDHVLYRSSPGTEAIASDSLFPSHTKIISDLLTGTTNLIKQTVLDKEISFKLLGIKGKFIWKKLDDPEFLINLKYSSYTADTVKLSHLLELFKQIAALSHSVTSSSPGIISPELINDILITSIVSTAQNPVVYEEYLKILWENKFLNKNINTLAKLLKKYKPNLTQSEKDIESILLKFQSEIITNEDGIKGKNTSKDTLVDSLKIPNDTFISWIQTKTTSVLDNSELKKTRIGKRARVDSNSLEEDND